MNILTLPGAFVIVTPAKQFIRTQREVGVDIVVTQGVFEVSLVIKHTHALEQPAAEGYLTERLRHSLNIWCLFKSFVVFQKFLRKRKLEVEFETNGVVEDYRREE